MSLSKCLYFGWPTIHSFVRVSGTLPTEGSFSSETASKVGVSRGTTGPRLVDRTINC